MSVLIIGEDLRRESVVTSNLGSKDSCYSMVVGACHELASLDKTCTYPESQSPGMS